MADTVARSSDLVKPSAYAETYRYKKSTPFFNQTKCTLLLHNALLTSYSGSFLWFSCAPCPLLSATFHRFLQLFSYFTLPPPPQPLFKNLIGRLSFNCLEVFFSSFFPPLFINFYPELQWHQFCFSDCRIIAAVVQKSIWKENANRGFYYIQ